MKDEEIKERIAQKDKDWKEYTNMKIRVVKNDIDEVDDNIRDELRLFFWMKRKPKQAILIFFIFILFCISVASSVDLKKFIADKFGIELKNTP